MTSSAERSPSSSRGASARRSRSAIGSNNAGRAELEGRIAERERRDQQLVESEQKLSERGREVDLREIAVAAVIEREAAVTAAGVLAAERERLLEERERQIGEREAALATQQAEVEERGKREPAGETEPEEPAYVETAMSARESDLEQRTAAIEGVENRIAEREAALEKRAATLTGIEQTLTRLQADIEREQQAAAETMRAIESREQAVARAEADLESRAAAVAQQERQAEAARKAGADEAERVRRESAELAARERALSGAQVEVEEPKKPAPAERGFLAGLDAMASASNQRRARRKQR